MNIQKSLNKAATIICMNVKYSPNLGDGLLSECLEAALITQGAHPDTSSVDLGARTAYGQTMAGRSTVMGVLDTMPSSLRHWAVRLPLALQVRRKWAPHYMDKLAKADAVAIGGGNLLTDHDLNFPTKVALTLNQCAPRKVPVALYGCGMGAHWSGEGDRRMRNALTLCPPKAVFLRDDTSKARWDARFADVSGQEAVVVRDPGLLARDTYGARPKSTGDGPLIGVGIMSHVAVRYHADARQTESELLKWYAALIQALVAQGARVTVFTNGAIEDNETLNLLRPGLAAHGDRIKIRLPSTPNDVSDILGELDALVAYRMHALIAAYSHAVPALALRWDDKVDSFLASIDRSDWLAEPADLPAPEAAKRLIAAAQSGVDPDKHTSVLQEAREDVQKLYDVLTS